MQCLHCNAPGSVFIYCYSSPFLQLPIILTPFLELPHVPCLNVSSVWDALLFCTHTLFSHLSCSSFHVDLALESSECPAQTLSDENTLLTFMSSPSLSSCSLQHDIIVSCLVSCLVLPLPCTPALHEDRSCAYHLHCIQS